MPVREVLECDSPDDSDEGEYVTIAVDGKTYEVILCAAHREQLRAVARWGNVVRGGRRGGGVARPRDASEERLKGLIRRSNGDKDK